LGVVPDEESVPMVPATEMFEPTKVFRADASDCAAANWAFDCWLRKMGTAIAARMPMMAITMSSSIRVKPVSASAFVKMDSTEASFRKDVPRHLHGTFLLSAVPPENDAPAPLLL
jgi:hypothetical protein